MNTVLKSCRRYTPIEVLRERLVAAKVVAPKRTNPDQRLYVSGSVLKQVGLNKQSA